MKIRSGCFKDSAVYRLGGIDTSIVQARSHNLLNSDLPKNFGISASLAKEETRNLRALEMKNPLAKLRCPWIWAASDLLMVPFSLTSSSILQSFCMRPSLSQRMKDPLFTLESWTEIPKALKSAAKSIALVPTFAWSHPKKGKKDSHRLRQES